MTMTAKRIRRLRVAARIQQLHEHPAFDAEVNQEALAWFLRDGQAADMLAVRLSPFTPDARRRLAAYPLRSHHPRLSRADSLGRQPTTTIIIEETP